MKRVYSVVALLLLAVLALAACGAITTERHSMFSGTVKAEFVDPTDYTRYLHLTFYQTGEYNISFAFGPDEKNRAEEDKDFIPPEQHVSVVTSGQTLDIQAQDWPTWFNVTVTNLDTGQSETVEFCSALACNAK